MNFVKIKQLNDKYNRTYSFELIIKYFTNYSYSFRQEDVERAYPNDEYLRKYKHRWFDSI